MEQRSKDVGLAISAASNVTDLGKAFPGQPSVAHDSNIEGLKRLAKAMKKNGAKAVVQIHHGGAQSLPNLTPDGDVAAPSPISLKSFGEQEAHDAMKLKREIESTIKAGEELEESLKLDSMVLKLRCKPLLNPSICISIL